MGEHSVAFQQSLSLSPEVMSQFSPGSHNWPHAGWSLLELCTAELELFPHLDPEPKRFLSSKWAFSLLIKPL